MRWTDRARESERRACRVACILAILAFCVFWAMCEMAHGMGPRDRHLVAKAAACGVDPFLAAELLHVETLAGLKVHRGMLLAKACRESRGNPEALGDWRQVRPDMRVAKAVGILQLWPWAEKYIHDRRDPIASAYVFLGALFDGMRRARRYCPRARRLFRLAWIRVNRGPFWRREDRKGQPRCHGTDPAGLKLLRRWGGDA